jgi:hypothetical protein
MMMKSRVKRPPASFIGAGEREGDCGPTRRCRSADGLPVRWGRDTHRA